MMMRWLDSLRQQRGVTLIELIVAMLVISVAMVGVLMVMNYTVSRSADPVIQHQALAIAEAYLEEIQLKAYSDPDGSSGESRANYDDVDDYDGLNDDPPLDQSGTEITALAGYRVSVSVRPHSFGPAGTQVAGKKITVRVQRGSEVDLTLVGYRAQY